MPSWKDVPYSAREKLLSKYEQDPRSVADAASALNMTLPALQRELRRHRERH